MNKRSFKRYISIFVVMIIFMLQPAKVYADPGDEVTDENVGEYSTRHPEQFSYSISFVENETMEEKLARIKEEGEGDNEIVNYYTIRYMSLTNDYPKELLNKKYRVMDSYIRWMARLSWNEDYSSEKSRLIYKIGVINTIETLESGDVVFTLKDNPEKRFLVVSNNDWAFQTKVTNPGDLVNLVTTTDRRVYHFDNWNLTRGLDISFRKFNSEHPEDVIAEGFFPSCLYKQRIEEAGISNEAIDLINEYTDPWLEKYYGEAENVDFQITPDLIISDEEWEKNWRALNSSCDEIFNGSRLNEDWASRDDLGWMGIDVTNVEGNIIARTEYIKNFEILDSGIRFTTWENPTRPCYFSNEYNAQEYVDLFSKNQKLFIYYNEDTREVYGIRNK